MNSLWTMVVYFLLPWRKERDELKKIYDDLYNASPSGNTQEDLKRANTILNEHQRKLESTRRKYAFKATSIKFSMACWAAWWFNLGIYLWEWYDKGISSSRFFYILLAISCLFMYGIDMIKKKRKRDELFVEGI
jgi:hypothetical protein